jgi:hypothetical protein
MIKSQSINKKTDRIYIYYMYQNQVQQKYYWYKQPFQNLDQHQNHKFL